MGGVILNSDTHPKPMRVGRGARPGRGPSGLRAGSTARPTPRVVGMRPRSGDETRLGRRKSKIDNGHAERMRVVRLCAERRPRTRRIQGRVGIGAPAGSGAGSVSIRAAVPERVKIEGFAYICFRNASGIRTNPDHNVRVRHHIHYSPCHRPGCHQQWRATRSRCAPSRHQRRPRPSSGAWSHCPLPPLSFVGRATGLNFPARSVWHCPGQTPVWRGRQ